MGDAEARTKFVLAVEKACRIAKIFNEHGVREYGVIRIDSAELRHRLGEGPGRKHRKTSPRPSAKPARSPSNTASASPPKAKSAGAACTRGRPCSTPSKRPACRTPSASRPTSPTPISICWATTPRKHALLKEGYTEAEFWAAYTTMTDALRPWTIDFHVAQNDGSVHGTGSHDKTGRHCLADDPNGKLDIPQRLRLLAQGCRLARHQAHLLGRLHVLQRSPRNPIHLAAHPRSHDQGRQSTLRLPQPFTIRRPRMDWRVVFIRHLT